MTCLVGVYKRPRRRDVQAIFGRKTHSAILMVLTSTAVYHSAIGREFKLAARTTSAA